MIDDYNDVHLHDERDDGGRQLAEEADFLHDWRISLDERLGITNTKHLYELLVEIAALDDQRYDHQGDSYMIHDVTISLGDVRLARELLR